MNREEAVKRSEETLDQLAHALEQGRSDTLIRYLKTLSRFHQYSFGNTLLIAIQRPDATHVAGYQRWKQLGRYVKHGEHGIAILAPLVYKQAAKDADDQAAGENPEAKVVRGFKVVHVFDVLQTEGKELPQFAEISGDPGEQLKRLETLIIESDIELSYEVMRTCSRRSIRLSNFAQRFFCVGLGFLAICSAMTFKEVRMEAAQEKTIETKNRSKTTKKPGANEPCRVIVSGQIEIALWLSQTATGITYPQFTLSRLFTSQSTGRKAASRYYDDTNEAELVEAIRLGAAATRTLREELASRRKAA